MFVSLLANSTTGKEVFVDIDPEVFRVILNVLRHNVLQVPETLSKELITRAAVSLGLSEVAKKMGGDVIKLNVGGIRMDTSRSTLCSEPRSMLAKMFGLTSEDGLDPSRMENNNFFLDTDPNTFHPQLASLPVPQSG